MRYFKKNRTIDNVEKEGDLTVPMMGEVRPVRETLNKSIHGGWSGMGSGQASSLLEDGGHGRMW